VIQVKINTLGKKQNNETKIFHIFAKLNTSPIFIQFLT